MTWVEQVTSAFDVDSAEVSETFGELTVDVAPTRWVSSLETARDALGLAFFDWLSAVDERTDGFNVVCHLYDPDQHNQLLIRTSLPAERPRVATATEVFRGAAWHERETAEMFGIDFEGHDPLKPLLLPDEFVEGARTHAVG